jgi:hypothetical protein
LSAAAIHEAWQMHRESLATTESYRLVQSRIASGESSEADVMRALDSLKTPKSLPHDSATLVSSVAAMNAIASVGEDDDLEFARNAPVDVCPDLMRDLRANPTPGAIALRLNLDAWSKARSQPFPLLEMSMQRVARGGIDEDAIRDLIVADRAYCEKYH